MDWVSIAVGAACGAIGGGIGALIGSIFKSDKARTLMTIAGAIVAIQLGRIFVIPWANIEYMFWQPSAEMQSLINLAPDHVGELKSMLAAAYRKGGTHKDFEQAGYEWGRKYASQSFMLLMASRDDKLSLASFDRYVALMGAAYKRAPKKCYAWIEGFGYVPEAQLGFKDAEHKILEQLVADRALLNKPQYAPIRGLPVPKATNAAVIANVQKNWDPARLDFADTAKPTKDLPPERGARVCYTMLAILSEAKALPPNKRLPYIRALFGGS